MTIARALIVVLLSAAIVSAQMTLNPCTIDDEGSDFRASVRVPHGCKVGEGEDRMYYPTHTVEVRRRLYCVRTCIQTRIIASSKVLAACSAINVTLA